MPGSEGHGKTLDYILNESRDGFLCSWIDELEFRGEGQAGTCESGSELHWVIVESMGAESITKVSLDDQCVSSREPGPTRK